jgi:hypothetical protein
MSFLTWFAHSPIASFVKVFGAGVLGWLLAWVVGCLTVPPDSLPTPLSGFRSLAFGPRGERTATRFGGDAGFKRGSSFRLWWGQGGTGI